ncbi:MAG: GNAT family N-acetyltransferase [Bacillota bacterium]|nr:GNAT family N-acetyltransferase [Bacillota bacterium]
MINVVFEAANKRAAAYDDKTFIGESTYSDAGAYWIIDHTEVDDAYAGQGIGKKLVYKIVEEAREGNKKIIPLCPYAKREFEKNKEYEDVLKK